MARAICAAYPLSGAPPCELAISSPLMRRLVNSLSVSRRCCSDGSGSERLPPSGSVRGASVFSKRAIFIPYPPDEFNLAFHGPSTLSIRKAESDRQISHLVIEEGFDGIEVGFCYECGTLNRPCSRISKVAEEVNDASGLGACRNVGPDRRGGRRRAAACQF